MAAECDRAQLSAQTDGRRHVQNYCHILYSFLSPLFPVAFGIMFFSHQENLLRSSRSRSWPRMSQYAWISEYQPSARIQPYQAARLYLRVAALFLYLSNKKVVYLILLVLSSVFSIFSNTEFGLFTFVALVITLLLRVFWKRSPHYRREIVGIPFDLCGSRPHRPVRSARESNQSVLHEGDFGAVDAKPQHRVLFSASSAFYVFLVKALNTRHNLRYIASFLFFYSQGILFYYVWNSVPNHFYSIATPFVLTLAVFLRYG